MLRPYSAMTFRNRSNAEDDPANGHTHTMFFQVSVHRRSAGGSRTTRARLQG
jgi:hypothetical protein